MRGKAQGRVEVCGDAANRFQNGRVTEYMVAERSGHRASALTADIKAAVRRFRAWWLAAGSA